MKRNSNMPTLREKLKYPDIDLSKCRVGKTVYDIFRIERGTIIKKMKTRIKVKFYNGLIITYDNSHIRLCLKSGI